MSNKNKKIKNFTHYNSGFLENNCTKPYKTYRDYYVDNDLTAEEYFERLKRVQEIQEKLAQERVEKNKRNPKKVNQEKEDELSR